MSQISFTVYDPATGKIRCSGSCAEGLLQQQAFEGLSVMEGQSDHRTDQVLMTDGVPTIVAIVDTPSLEDLKSAAKAAAAQRRWEIEMDGVSFCGGILATDDRSKLLLSDAATKARGDPTFTVKWKLSDGSWATLDAPTILAAYDAVFTWVSQCFAQEAALDGQIDASADADAVAALATAIQAFWSP